MGKVSIRDVARMANVSPTAVSFVLNNKKGVSEDTRSRILHIIEETGFVPDINSRRFYYRKKFTVALIGSPMASPFQDIFYYEVARGLEKECSEAGYSVIFTALRQKGSTLVLPEVVTQRDTDGLVFLLDIPGEIRDSVRAAGLPYVVVDASCPEEDITSVYVDYEQAAYRATRYLADSGHTDIAFFGASRSPEFYARTLAGYQRAMDCVRSIPPAYIESRANDDGGTVACMESLLQVSPRPTAVFCATDMIALCAMNHARSRGIRIPEDISFIGIDDVLISSYVYPALTSVRVDKTEMGKKAMEILLRKIGGDTPESQEIELGPVVERASVQKI